MFQHLIKSSINALDTCATYNFITLRHSSTRCLFRKQSRLTYPRMYKTRIYLEDGSSVTVRCSAPRKFIQLPLDYAALDENEQRRVWLNRKTKIEIKESDAVAADEYDSSRYRKYWK